MQTRFGARTKRPVLDLAQQGRGEQSVCCKGSLRPIAAHQDCSGSFARGEAGTPCVKRHDFVSALRTRPPSRTYLQKQGGVIEGTF